jgi:GT2 family glycosyltransferase/SAM-dependent methyltransferase
MRRRAGAPRLIEWTGERCVPWAPDVPVVYEHLHRYLWAAALVKGCRVLDVASGEGFGAAILAEAAASVVGIDIDERTVEHSRLNYSDERVRFQIGDALDLSQFEPDSFDAVVAFEVIEHLEDHQRLLDQIKRVLEPEGLLIMSTPDRTAYTLATGHHNPFHTHELARTEFSALLRSRFAHVATWGQRTVTGSALSALAPSEAPEVPARTYFVERHGVDWDLAAGLSPLYLVSVASDAELPQIPAESTLADPALTLLRSAEATAREEVAGLQAERAGLEAERDRVRRELSDRHVELTLSEKRVKELAERSAQLEVEVADARQIAARVEQSVSWHMFERIRGAVLGLMGGPGSMPVRLIKRGLAVWLRHRRAQAVETVPIELPEFEEPLVSIVIPLHAGAALTRACLESIRDRTISAGYEVILVDDAADAETKALLAGTQGAQIITNGKNLGYARSVKVGAARARGRWLVLCNNDIQVQEGWLGAMLRCAESSPDIGIVTPKYIYPDGSLQEAGGVIWSDGTGGQYGRGDRPGEPRYEFRRDVDYGSAAALMVRADFWREVGGFDERFEPMYYEDTDLCFQAREHGLRVVYEPRANVIHIEGGSAGTDISVGHKRHQESNRPKFVEKWRERLEREQLPANWNNVRRASNRHRGPHVLILDHRVPFWDRDSGSLRMHGMIRALLDMGCRVTFFPDDLAVTHPYTLELQSLGVEVWYGEIDVQGELAEIGPGLALVIACRPHASSRWLDLIREWAPLARIVYDTVDLHWLREARRAEMEGGGDQATLGPRAGVLRELELALIRATDATLVVSDEERAQVEADVPGATVVVVPNINEVRPGVPPAGVRRGVLFIGGFEHSPNVEGAIRLVRRVMPRVWSELGDVPVTIVGGSVPPAVSALASGRVEIAGWVPDVGPLFDAARVMVAPLSYGAGLKGKVTQSLAMGLPVVTTPVGAEGLHATSGEELLVGADDRELADGVIAVLRDDALWSRLSANGQQVAAERFSPAVVVQRLAELLGDRVDIPAQISSA